jgi:hypothetical protein
MLVWSGLRIYYQEEGEQGVQHGQDEQEQRDEVVMSLVLGCPFLQEQNTDFYAYKLPIFVLLIANSFFLVWIMVIVVSKLRARTALDHDRRHYKAAKALVIVIPLLGFTYLLTFIGPSKESSPLAYTVFQSVRAVLLSTQGGVITLPYCYCNTEVQGVLKQRYHRWQVVRNIEYPSLHSTSTRTSLATSTVYYTQVGGSSKLKMMTTKVDGGLLNIPSTPSQTCSRNNSRSVSFTEISQQPPPTSAPPPPYTDACQDSQPLQQGDPPEHQHGGAHLIHPDM